MDIDIPENLNLKFQIPKGFLEKLYEFTGNKEGNSGFILGYVDDDGKPLVISKSSNQIVDMGLRKALEKYLIQMEEGEMSVDLNDGS